MDDGYTIAGLNEGWTLGGARLMEWVSGFVMAMITQELLHIKMANSGPLMIIVVVATTFTLAGLRRGFPDEERGLRNAAMVGLGFEPPGLPAPAVFKPFWSGAPVRNLPGKTYFKTLELDVLFVPDAANLDRGSMFLNPSRSTQELTASANKENASANTGGSEG